MATKPNSKESRKSSVYKVKPLTDSKKEFLNRFITDFDIHSTEDIDNALKDLVGGAIQLIMDGEITHHLGYDKYERSDSSNSRNGSKKKKLNSQYGQIEISVPKDRDSSFSPKIVKNHQKDISSIENKIIALYSSGMSTRNIAAQLRDLYGIECSEGFISDVTDVILKDVAQWQSRPLEEVYPIIYIDAVYFSVRKDGIVKKLAAYVMLGITLLGKKEVLGIHLSASESAKIWLSIFNELKNRGVKDVMLVCADGLTGIKEAIEAAFPRTEYQRCIIHMIRNTLRYVNYKDRKAFAADLKDIYLAFSEEAGRKALDAVTAKWQSHYPVSMNSWHKHWDELCPIYQFSMPVRKVIYTTNAIESLNSTYRSLNRQRPVFPTEQALMKTLYLSTQKATAKWTMPIRDWVNVYSEFCIMYGDRMSNSEK